VQTLITPHVSALDYAEVLAQALEHAKVVMPMITDVTQQIYQHIANHENILFEGAQGALLDIDQGTYPFPMPKRHNSALMRSYDIP
jgi:adenylosuccinate synthase